MGRRDPERIDMKANPMSLATTPSLTFGWTAADLVDRFGAIPLGRIRLDPAPGTATEADVVVIRISGRDSSPFR